MITITHPKDIIKYCPRCGFKDFIWEEPGVKVTKTTFLVSFSNEYIFSGLSVFTVDLAFICKVDDLNRIVPADDVSEIEFIFPEEIKAEELCSESMVNFINHYIKTIK